MSALIHYFFVDKIDLQTATNQDLPIGDRVLYVRKTGRTTGTTTGILRSASHYPCIGSLLYFGRFFDFNSCYFIDDDDEEDVEVADRKLFFDRGDSGSAVYLIDNKHNPKIFKPLGIGFAIGIKGGTYACKIQEVLREFNIAIYQEQV